MFSSKRTTTCLMGVAVDPWPWWPVGAAAQPGAAAPRTGRAAAPASAPRPRIVARLPLLAMRLHLPGRIVCASYGLGRPAGRAARWRSHDGAGVNTGSGKPGQLLTVY